MSTDHRDDRAASFDRAAAVYQATRPSYPDEAVRWSVPEHARDVLDLAAGTGKLTERLVALGFHVVAVEPSDAMRAELTAALPAVEASPGTAERMSLPDASDGSTATTCQPSATSRSVSLPVPAARSRTSRASAGTDHRTASSG